MMIFIHECVFTQGTLQGNDNTSILFPIYKDEVYIDAIVTLTLHTASVSDLT